MNIHLSFHHERFIDWNKTVETLGGTVYCVVDFPGKHFSSLGDPKMAGILFEKKLFKAKRRSMEWVKDPSSLPKLSRPIKGMNQKVSNLEAPKVLRHFIGDKSYGSGECFFWNHCVPIDSLNHS